MSTRAGNTCGLFCFWPGSLSLPVAAAPSPIPFILIRPIERQGLTVSTERAGINRVAKMTSIPFVTRIHC